MIQDWFDSRGGDFRFWLPNFPGQFSHYTVRILGHKAAGT